ncbi:hypothetical protein SAMN05444266_10196 [Chitinophaga jiangningensis]|uniref:Uncharacterized protein n=1 Tax=Chitinophaga jiangningensis TaxID=1419482 RepID=A0A1M6V7V7_9BACT|nr:hypothetical protein [Chitinophaga jiangningensis]SHK77464.1 hypothetical protein SAMN05444266_10196 [Chitinophaga jiangningensis]
MGTFNRLRITIICPDCGGVQEAYIQYKFGSTWQYTYKIGDTITWGGNNHGKPELKKVKAYGIIESTTCIFCEKNNIPEEYDIVIENNIIQSVQPMDSYEDYMQEITGGNYLTL